MTLIDAFVLGILEGLTEFLPISSTFHLIFASQLLNMPQTEFLKTFEVFIQAGAILAVLWLYGKELWQDRVLTQKVVVSFIPTAIVGYLLHSIIKRVFFETNWLMIAAFIVFGLVFIGYEWWLKKNPRFLAKTIDQLTWQQAIVIGLGQAVAVLPGVSRAGAVMLTMMFLHTKRDQAAKYSFLLALPTICAAALLDLIKLRDQLTLTNNDLLLLAVGSVTAFASALFVLKWFIKYLQTNTLTPFGIYRLIMGVALASLFLGR
jgi:undecaprenyl-diphosphatase